MSELPLFLVHSVLFPNGRFRLRVFEKRYMDMVTHCIKHETPFGVCLIRAGHEVGEAAQPSLIGTIANLDEYDMPQTGILHISVRGGECFRVLDTRVLADQLIMGETALLPEEPHVGLGPAHEDLRELLAKILNEVDGRYYYPPIRLDDATWVAYRLAELLPVSNNCRQQVLEQPDPRRKLDILAAQIKAPETETS
ncbi:MAG: LON peptidase substrate-binding domain-containing protein [Acidiferrobacterales bacterium]